MKRRGERSKGANYVSFFLFAFSGTPAVVIGKLVGALVWGMMEGIRRNLKQLDGGSVSVSGVYQLRLDFCFLETILSRYILLDFLLCTLLIFC